MTTDCAAITGFSESEAPVPVDHSGYRRSVLCAIEAALTKARIDAGAFEYPMLAYFVEMAITEIKNGEGTINKDLVSNKGV